MLLKKNYFLFLLLFVAVLKAQSVSLYEPVSQTPYPDTLLFCPGENFQLKVDAAATSTGNYLVKKESPTTYNLSAGSTNIVFAPNGRDKFSQPISIGFNFSFYGKIYTRVVLGSNGRLVFTNSSELSNLNDITKYKDRTFSGTLNPVAALPSTNYNKVYADPTQELNLAQIFMGYTDLRTSSEVSSVTYRYKNIVHNGVNGLLISFQQMIRTNGVGGDSPVAYDSFVLLLEDGRVIIYVVNKTEDTYNAILGIQNDDATKALVPVHSTPVYNYNNGPWKSENVVWTFVPNQNLTPQFRWFRNGVLIPAQTGDQLNTGTLVPALANGDIVKVEVTYLDEDGTPVGMPVSDQITFEALQKPVITYNSNTACVAGVSMSVTPKSGVQYEWFRTGNATVLGTGNTFYANQNGSYFVRATRAFLPGCSLDSDPVTVNLNSTLPSFNESNAPLYYCETAGVVTKTLNLYQYYPANASAYTVKFYYQGSEIADPSQFVLNPNSEYALRIEVKDLNSACELSHQFTIRYDALPAPLNNLTANYCYGITALDGKDFLASVAGQYIASFDYLYSVDGVNFTANSVFNPATHPKLWIKIRPKNALPASCETISSIIFSERAKVVANAPTTQLPPQCAGPTETFDLASLIPEINSGNVTVTFHENLGDAESGQNAVPYNFRAGLDTTTLYIRVEDNITHCVSPDHPTVTLLVYRKPALKISTITKKNCTGNSIFNLTQSAQDLTTAEPPVTVTLEYYAQNGTQLTPAQIANYDAAVFGLQPYIKVIYNPTCSDTVTFDLGYYPKPAAAVSQIVICSELSYSLQNFKNQVTVTPNQYLFTDAAGNPLPASFDVSVLPKAVQFYMEDVTTHCKSDLQTVTFVKGDKMPLLTDETDYVLCDSDFDGHTTFNLDSKKAAFTADAAATFEYFKDAGLTQSLSSTYTNETPFAQTVYVKISTTGKCPSYGKIFLKANVPTKSSTLLDTYQICYGETLLVDAGSENIAWKWSTGATTQVLAITAPGNYSVELTNAEGCTYTHTFVVSDEDQPKIEVINQTNNSLEVIASGGEQPYTYYFNGVPQSSNILMNPAASSYTVQVRGANGCLGPPKTVFFIKINNAFTPNGDGINDIWKIENLDQMQDISIIITDRYGTKVFESLTPNNVGWDGKMRGRALPTASYWYVVQWFDPVTQKTERRQGWILLKNRN